MTDQPLEVASNDSQEPLFVQSRAPYTQQPIASQALNNRQPARLKGRTSMSHQDRNLSPPLPPGTPGFVPEEPSEPEPVGITEEERARIQIGTDGGPLCD